MGHEHRPSQCGFAHLTAHGKTTAVIPAKAGIHFDFGRLQEQMDPGFRRDDSVLASRFACNTALA
jgi:hypothetical protein